MQGVHVWSASLERPASEVSALHEILDVPERARAARFVKERDRRRYVVGRATLRKLLGEYTGKDAARVDLTTLPGGKPVLACEDETPPLHFNVSHCGDVALFAFADREVGIDVERLAPISDMEQVATHFFSSDEVLAFRQLSGRERTRFFFRIWVRKEAYVKATGDGFAIDPARIRFAGAAPAGLTVKDGAAISTTDCRYSLHDLADIDDYVAAIALRVPDSTLNTGIRHNGAGTGRNTVRDAPRFPSSRCGGLERISLAAAYQRNRMALCEKQHGEGGLASVATEGD